MEEEIDYGSIKPHIIRVNAEYAAERRRVELEEIKKKRKEKIDKLLNK